MKRRGYTVRKGSLTPAEQIRAAQAVLVDGIDQHKVAALLGVNPGRVAEAVTAVRNAVAAKPEPEIKKRRGNGKK